MALSIAPLSLSACGDSGPRQPPQAAAESSVAASQPSTPVESAPPTETPTEEVTPTEPVEETSAPVLRPEVAGQPLALSKFFHSPETWKDSRFDVADRKQVAGIGGTIMHCGDGSDGDELELRLANNFHKLKMDVGQSNSSQDSDQTMIVRVDTNGQYRDLKKIKLNQIASFDLKVDRVNALKIIVSMDSDVQNCGFGTVEAVLMNLVLS